MLVNNIEEKCPLYISLTNYHQVDPLMFNKCSTNLVINNLQFPFSTTTKEHLQHVLCTVPKGFTLAVKS